MSLHDEMRPWLDKYGFVSPYAPTDDAGDYRSENGWYYSGFYFDLCSDPDWFSQMEDTLTICHVKRGVFRRAPTSRDFCSFDDWLGIGIISAYGAMELLKNPKTWLQPQVRAHLHWGSGVHPNALYRAYWAASVWLSGFIDPLDHSAHGRTYLLVKQAECVAAWKAFPLVRAAIQSWKRRYARACYGAGLDPKDLFARMVDRGHPLSDAFRRDEDHFFKLTELKSLANGNGSRG